MNTATLPMLEIALTLPWIGAAAIPLFRSTPAAARFSLTLGATATPPSRIFAIDPVAAPMLPVLVLLHLLTLLGTAKSRVTPALCVRILLATFVGLAVVTCQDPWILVGLLSVAPLLPYGELRALGKPTRGFALHMGAFVFLLALGQGLIAYGSATAGTAAILTALLVRGGIAPFHAWVPRLFERASYATAMLFVLPLMEVAATLRLVLPHASSTWLAAAAWIPLATAIFGGGMAIVQSDVRRFYAHLCLSQTSLVLFGVLLGSVTGLTAALCLWVSTAIALACLAFSLRAVEARFGRLPLTQFHGLYDQVPGLAVTFLLTGLACVGFPGTVGFLPMELLFAGSVDHGLGVSVALALAAMFNGVAILRAYFALFTGRRPATTLSLATTRLERAGIVLIALIVVAGTWIPSTFIASRHQVAEQLLGQPVSGSAHPTP